MGFIASGGPGVIVNGLNSAYPASVVEDSAYCTLQSKLGRLRKKGSVALSGAGAQNVNLFTVTGTILLARLFGELTTVTDSTTFSTVYFDLWDGTVSRDITLNTGVDCSGAAVESVIMRARAATNAALFQNANACRLQDYGLNFTENTIITAKTGVTTYVRFNFTGDGSTDIVADFCAGFQPMNGGELTAV